MTDIVLIQKALESSRVMDEDAEITRKFLVGVITRVHVIAGQAVDKNTLEFMAAELKKDLYSRFKGLTLKEVELALTNGVKGDYGEYYGLNIRSFNKFLNAYTFSEERGRAIEAGRNRIDSSKQITAKGSITKEENERISIENAIYTFVEYKQTRECFDPGNCVYDFLDKRSLISFSSAEKWGFMEEAKKQREMERKFLGKTMLISDVMEKQQEGGIVVAYAKKIALKRYFGDLVKSGVELQTILNDKP